MPKKSIAEKSVYWLKVISLGLIVGIGIQFAKAWTNPSSPAPASTIGGPLTIGTTNQVKAASLGLVGNLIAGGMIKIGQSAAICDASLGGAMRYNTIKKCVESCDETDWLCIKNDPPPSINCVGSFVNTGVCNKTCGGGVMQQVYTITTPAQNGGIPCPYSSGQVQWGSTSCNIQACTWSCICNGNQPPIIMSSNVTGQGCSYISTCGNCGQGSGVHWSSCTPQ